LTVLFAITIKINAQIPNNGFEQWYNVGNCMRPTGWGSTNDWTDTTGSYFAVTRSTDHFPVSVGNYSIRIETKASLLPAFWAQGYACLGYPGQYLRPGFAITGHPNSWNGYYKFLPQNGDTMFIYIRLFYNGVVVSDNALTSTDTVANWTPFTINLPSYTQADSAAIVLASYYFNMGIPQGNSILYVDNLSFDGLISSISDQTVKNTFFNLYPNPASDIVTLNIENKNNADLTLNIYAIAGTLVKSEILKQNNRQINIKDLCNGIYMVEIKSIDFIESQRLIIQR